MNKSDSELSDDQIKSLFGSENEIKTDDFDKQRGKALVRARASVGQRDTIMFAFIKIWTVLADLLAPLFASFAVKKSSVTKPTRINKH